MDAARAARGGRRRAGTRAPLLAAAAAAAVAAAAAGGAGCDFFDEPGPVTPAAAAATAARTAPDDSDPIALLPPDLETLIDLDMTAIRASAWTSPLFDLGDNAEHASKTAALGYDDATDVDRVVYAVTVGGAAGPTLTVARGRFRAGRVEDAFRTRWTDATVTVVRGTRLATSGDNAVAVLLERTLVAGTPAAVRGVLERAWGARPASEPADQSLGVLRRALLGTGAGATTPAALALIAVDDGVRARVAGSSPLPLPPELRQVGARLDVGSSVARLSALALLDDHASAAAFGRRVGALLLSREVRFALDAIGLGDLATAARVTIDGARVRLQTALDEDRRPAVVAALKTLGAALRQR